ncbi:MAG: hypothetical protein AAF628_14845 [Planctomycetota bacterium]
MCCPICQGALEERDVAPCYECGHRPEQLRQLTKPAFQTFAIFGQEIVLCDVCEADFDSNDPEFFGLAAGVSLPSLGEPKRQLVGPRRARDGYCSQCQCRRAFLQLVKAARERAS